MTHATVNENTIPMELMPEGYFPSIYAPLPGTPGTWMALIHRPGLQPSGIPGFKMGYGGTPRQAVISALAAAYRDDTPPPLDTAPVNPAPRPKPLTPVGAE